MASKEQTKKGDLKKVSGGGTNPIGGPLGAKPSAPTKPSTKPATDVSLNPTSKSGKGGPSKL